MNEHSPQTSFPNYSKETGLWPTSRQLQLLKTQKNVQIEGEWYPSLRSLCTLKGVHLEKSRRKKGAIIEKLEEARAYEESTKEATEALQARVTAIVTNRGAPKRQLSEGHKKVSQEDEGAPKKVASLGRSLFRVASIEEEDAAAESGQPLESGTSDEEGFQLVFDEDQTEPPTEAEASTATPDKICVYNGIHNQKIMNEVLTKLNQLKNHTVPSKPSRRKEIVGRVIQNNIERYQANNTHTINIDKVCRILCEKYPLSSLPMSAGEIARYIMTVCSPENAEALALLNDKGGKNYRAEVEAKKLEADTDPLNIFEDCFNNSEMTFPHPNPACKLCGHLSTDFVAPRRMESLKRYFQILNGAFSQSYQNHNKSGNLQHEDEIPFSDFATFSSPHIAAAQLPAGSAEALVNFMYWATRSNPHMFMALSVLDPQMMMETGMTPTKTKAEPRTKSPPMMVKADFTALVEKQAAMTANANDQLINKLAGLLQLDQPDDADEKSKLRAELLQLNELIKNESEGYIIDLHAQRKVEVVALLYPKAQ